MTLTADAGIAVVATSDDLMINIEHAQLFRFSTDVRREIEIIAESTDTGLFLWLADDDGKPLARSSLHPYGQFRNRIVYEVEIPGDYVIGVAARDEESLPARFRVGVFEAGAADWSLDPAIPTSVLELGDSTLVLDQDAPTYYGRPARYFFFRPMDTSGSWIRAEVNSSTISPMVIFFDEDGSEKLGTGWLNRSKRTAQSVIQSNYERVLVIVSLAHGTSWEQEQVEGAEVSLVLSEHRFNPAATWKEKLRAFLADPLIGFVAGLTTALVVSALFYLLSNRRRRLSFDIDVDRVAFDPHHTSASELRLLLRDKPITEYVGLGVVRLLYTGRRDAKKPDVNKPIVIRFAPVTRLLRARLHGTSGWTGIATVASDMCALELQFDHLRDGDEALLDVLYTQESPKSLNCELSGRLHDGILGPHSRKFDQVRNALLVLSLAPFSLGLFLLVVDFYANILPLWLAQFLDGAIPYLWVPIIAYAATGRRARRWVFELRHGRMPWKDSPENERYSVTSEINIAPESADDGAGNRSPSDP